MDEQIDPHVMIMLVKWSARHNLSVASVLATAVATFLADVDAGLLAAPQPELRSLLGRPRRCASWRRTGA